jgi:fructose-specific phosphotransferase system IIC component
VLGDETMLQGIIAGWIFILFMAALFVDENLRHAIPSLFGVFLAVVVVTLPIWVPIVLDNKHKREKAKKQVIEIEVFK